MPQTKLANLINPEVMAAMVGGTLPKKIKFTKFASIDNTLEQQAGDTITVPKYAYIGAAADVAEGVAMGTTTLTASTTTVTVKETGKAVEITDKAALSAFGDPIGEAGKQLAMAIADKIDDDCYAALQTATLQYNGSAAIIGYEPVVNAVDLFEDENDAAVSKVIFVNPKQITQLRKDADFKDINKYPITNGVIMSGTIGQIAGCQVVPSKRVTNDGTSYLCPIVVVDAADPNEATTADHFDTSASALTIYMKRDILMETDRDILARTTVMTATENYGVALTNDSKVVLAKFKMA